MLLNKKEYKQKKKKKKKRVFTNCIPKTLRFTWKENI